jgi:polyisoprenoid-binding protein YceI
MRTSQRLLSISTLILSLAAAGQASAEAKTYKVQGGGASKIQFVSEAPLEKFTGASTGLSGELKLDPAKANEAKGDIKVEVKTIKTGLSLRDEHLHAENWLDAAKFPEAKFVISKITGVTSLKPGETVEATVVGKFTLHGVTQDITAKAKVRNAVAGNEQTLHVLATFTVKLEDHKVSIPSIVALKVSKEIQVNVDLTAKAS